MIYFHSISNHKIGAIFLYDVKQRHSLSFSLSRSGTPAMIYNDIEKEKASVGTMQARN